jgi:hypothetical protein
MKEKKSRRKRDEEIGERKKKNPEIEFLSKVSDLTKLEEQYLVEEKYDKAINISEKIIRLSIRNGKEHLINEQREFMNKIALKVQNSFYFTEINEAGKKIEKIYNILLDSANYSQAHDILEAFKQNYSDKIDINSIPIIKKLNQKDIKEGIKNKLM